VMPTMADGSGCRRNGSNELPKFGRQMGRQAVKSRSCEPTKSRSLNSK
jgi:hypothetical protein